MHTVSTRKQVCAHTPVRNAIPAVEPCHLHMAPSCDNVTCWLCHFDGIKYVRHLPLACLQHPDHSRRSLRSVIGFQCSQGALKRHSPMHH